ncbi:MAG TPA: chemotaxis protein CheW [Steroidobacteraceae bacterium]|nr:chemotaxis protein CheW [Steroidobacteraceae bacterium]
MPAVGAYAQRLAGLQTVWDNLSLLAQLGASDAESISRTRTAFESLSGELVRHLAAETARKSVTALGAKAQMAIDVLVRNLFERTADIGFLCQDDAIIAYLKEEKSGAERSPAAAAALRQRLREYVAKYSVYADVVLMRPDGRIVGRLIEDSGRTHTTDTALTAALNTSQPYVEHFGPSDLLGDGAPVLRYAWRVTLGTEVLGALCLCFQFDDEMQSIFQRLLGPQEWTVLALLNREGTVLASSDPWQCPVGAKLESGSASGRVTRFAGREYLAVTQEPHPYQGYEGPGWLGHAMVPLEHAFGSAESSDPAGQSPGVYEQGAEIFSPELQQIPQRARDIQNDLALSVWNGNVRLTSRGGGDSTFSRALLRELSQTGRRTQEIFDRSIADLQQTVLSALLLDCTLRASLAADIVDRNLYERVNDCRWWALNGTLRDALEGSTPPEKATEILAGINALYTVYDSILLFDGQCRITAVSNPRHQALVGTTLSQGWARQTLALRDSQSWTVSPFEPQPAYDGRHGYVFCAAVRDAQGRTLGGVALVFDSEPQLRAICNDALIGLEDARSVVVLIDANGTVLAASGLFKAGERAPFDATLTQPPAAGAQGFIERDGLRYAAGAHRGVGYREFAGLGTTAITLRPVASHAVARAEEIVFRFTHRAPRGEGAIDLATLRIGPYWIGLPSTDILDALRDPAVIRLPDQPAWQAGAMLHDDRSIRVIDLRVLLGAPVTATTGLVVVVCSAGQSLGLIADALGDVVQVSADEVVTLDGASQPTGNSLTPQTLVPRSPEDSAVLLLDLARLGKMST